MWALLVVQACRLGNQEYPVSQQENLQLNYGNFTCRDSGRFKLSVNLRNFSLVCGVRSELVSGGICSTTANIHLSKPTPVGHSFPLCYIARGNKALQPWEQTSVSVDFCGLTEVHRFSASVYQAVHRGGDCGVQAGYILLLSYGRYVMQAFGIVMKTICMTI